MRIQARGKSDFGLRRLERPQQAREKPLFHKGFGVQPLTHCHSLWYNIYS